MEVRRVVRAADKKSVLVWIMASFEKEISEKKKMLKGKGEKKGGKGMTIWCETRVGINKKWEFEFFSFLQMISTLWSFLYICGMASPFHLCSTSAL